MKRNVLNLRDIDGIPSQNGNVKTPHGLYLRAANSVVDKALSHNDAHKKNAYRPDVKTNTIKVSRHDSYKKVAAKVENMKGVMDTN